MRISVFILFMILLCFSCNENYSAYKALKVNDGEYRIVNKINEKIQKDSQYLVYSLLFQDNKGNVLLDKRNDNQLLREQIVFDHVHNTDLSPLSELLRYLNKGDSAVLRVPVKAGDRKNELKDADSLYYFVKIKDILSENEVLEYIKNDLQESQKVVIDRQRQYLSSKEKLNELLSDIKQGKNLSEKMLTPNRLIYYILEAGNGEKLKSAQEISFDYIGFLTRNNKEFDNSYNKPDGIKFKSSDKAELKAWKEIFSVMEKGMLAVFFVPHSEAYGKSGKPGVIPPESDLILCIRVKKVLN
jgi:FKBP-type peptidyl-prolyl cis-trans isomerase